MLQDAALLYRKAREILVQLYPLEPAAWDQAIPETHVLPYGFTGEINLIQSGDFLGFVARFSPGGQPYLEFRSVPVRPTRREVYGKTAEGQIEYAGYLVSDVAWRAEEHHERDATYHRNHRGRP